MKKIIIRAMSLALAVVMAMAVSVVAVSAANTKTLTLSVTTSNDFMAGTNAEIHVQFTDVNGKKSQQFNLESIIGKEEKAFERGCTDIAVMQLPADFGTIKTVTFTSKLIFVNDTISSNYSDWKLESFQVDFDGNTYIATMNQWCDIGESISYTFNY